MSVSIPRVLDLLMAFIVVMFIPIGLWRGALREWMALGGIMLASAFAAEWAVAGGDNLAAWASIDARVARFAVGSLAFIGVTLVVGYGSGVALPYRPDLTWPNRLTGAALSLVNGLLILSGALRIMQRFLFDDARTSPLLTSLLANYLITSIGWTLLALVTLLVASVGAGLRRRWDGLPALFDEFVPGDYMEERMDWPARPAAPPIDQSDRPGAESDNDAESWRELHPAIGAAFAAQDTDVLRLVPTPEGARANGDAGLAPSADASLAAPQPGNTSRVNSAVVTIPRPESRPAEPTIGLGAGEGMAVAARPIVRDTEQPADATPTTMRAPRDESDRDALLASNCAVCGAHLPARRRFCAACGHIVGKTERRSLHAWPSD